MAGQETDAARMVTHELAPNKDKVVAMKSDFAVPVLAHCTSACMTLTVQHSDEESEDAIFNSCLSLTAAGDHIAKTSTAKLDARIWASKALLP